VKLAMDYECPSKDARTCTAARAAGLEFALQAHTLDAQRW
jgi:hypothetical protein